MVYYTHTPDLFHISGLTSYSFTVRIDVNMSADLEKEQEHNCPPNDDVVHLISSTGYGKSSKELIDLMSQLRALGYVAANSETPSVTDAIL